MPWWMEALIGVGAFGVGTLLGVKLKGKAPVDPKRLGIGKR